MLFGVEPSPVTSLCITSVWARGAWVNVAFQAEAWHRDEVSPTIKIRKRQGIRGRCALIDSEDLQDQANYYKRSAFVLMKGYHCMFDIFFSIVIPLFLM